MSGIHVYFMNDWRGFVGIRWLSVSMQAGRWWLYAHLAICGLSIQVETPAAWCKWYDRTNDRMRVERFLETVP